MTIVGEIGFQLWGFVKTLSTQLRCYLIQELWFPSTTFFD